MAWKNSKTKNNNRLLVHLVTITNIVSVTAITLYLYATGYGASNSSFYAYTFFFPLLNGALCSTTLVTAYFWYRLRGTIVKGKQNVREMPVAGVIIIYTICAIIDPAHIMFYVFEVSNAATAGAALSAVVQLGACIYFFVQVGLTFRILREKFKTIVSGGNANALNKWNHLRLTVIFLGINAVCILLCVICSALVAFTTFFWAPNAYAGISALFDLARIGTIWTQALALRPPPEIGGTFASAFGTFGTGRTTKSSKLDSKMSTKKSKSNMSNSGFTKSGTSVSNASGTDIEMSEQNNNNTSASEAEEIEPSVLTETFIDRALDEKEDV
jgi:hypothetical protein